MKVKLTDLKQKVNDGVKKLGYKGQDAEIISEVLFYAQLRGNNQGITKIATGGVPEAIDVEDYRVTKKNKCGALVSGGHSMVAVKHAADLAVDLAEEHGMGVVGSNHTFSSSGAIGYYARQIADKGFIGLVFVSTAPLVAPYGASKAMLGTNPISYAIPTSTNSVVFDITTAAKAYFGVVEAKLNGEQLSDGTGFDAEGNPTTDPAKVLDGAIATFAQHRGFGLSLLVQVLGGPLIGAGFLGQNKENGSGGAVVIAIDPGLFIDKEEFIKNTDALLKQIKDADPIKGIKEVLIPGERGDRIADLAMDIGEIEITDAVWKELVNFVEE